jgi:hypothetical protein
MSVRVIYLLLAAALTLFWAIVYQAIWWLAGLV